MPFDPESKGGSEAAVRIAKADLIPTTANMREKYGSFAELRGACAIFCQQVNTRVHRETGRTPASGTRGALPGTELEVRARIGARTEADLALKDWEPIKQLAPSVLAVTLAGTATTPQVWS